MATSLRPFDGQLDTPAPSTGLRPFDGTLDDEQPKAGVGGRLKDAGLALAKGVVGVPEAAVGLADIVTGGGVGKALENEGGTFGFRPKQAKDYLSSLQSDAYKAEQQQFSEAEGIGGKALAALQNPALVANTVVESAPSMLGGAALARGAGMAVPAIAGRLGLTAAGEGAVMAGSQAEQIRQQTEDGLLTPQQAALSAATGLVGGAAGALGSRAARALGVGDIDQMIASGAIKGSARQGLGVANRGARGALTEGVFEELPQSLAETGLQNIALDRPVTQGMEESAVMGTLAGGVMGAGAGVVSGLGQKPPGVTEQEWQTILGAGDPDAIRPEVPPVEAPDLTTAPGAAEPRTGMDFTRDVDTSGLSLTPSEAMGLDPSAGPLSRAAASAVDSGAMQALQQAAAPQLEMNERPDGTLMVTGDFNAIRSQLVESGIPAQSIIRNMRGATVGRTQAQAARQALSTQQEAANVSTPAPVQRTTDTSAGTGSAQPETGVPAGVGSSERGTGLAAPDAELATGGDGGGRPVAAAAVDSPSLTTNVQNQPQGTSRAETQAAPVEARAPARGDAASVTGTPAATGAGDVQADGVAGEVDSIADLPGVEPGDRLEMFGPRGLKGNSWVLREKATGRAIEETRNPAKVRKLNTKKYEAVPIGRHLADLNDPTTPAYASARDLSKKSPNLNASAKPAQKTAKTEQVAKAPAEPAKPDPAPRPKAEKPQDVQFSVDDSANRKDKVIDLLLGRATALATSDGDVRSNVRDAVATIGGMSDRQNNALDRLLSALDEAEVSYNDSQRKAKSVTVDKIDSEINSAIESGTLDELVGRDGVGADGLLEELLSAMGRNLLSSVPVTESSEFKRWFGDSKVVDADGKPLVVYHGTNQEYSAFNTARLGMNTQASSALGGFFFTSDSTEAGDYADLAASKMIPGAPAHEAKTERLMREVEAAERTANRTGRWDKYDALVQELEAHEYDAINEDPSGANVLPVYLSVQNPKLVTVGGPVSTGEVTKLIDAAKAAGHDGLILRDIADNPKGSGGKRADHYVVFRPEQIKSAIGNAGTFDPANPDIRFDAATSEATPAAYPPASQAHQKAATAFAERLSKNRDSFVLMDAVKPTGARAKEAQSVSDLAKTMFGREVVFVKFKGRPLFNGAVSTTDPGKVFVNIESARPMMAVLGHELLHELRKSNPAAYNQLAKTLKTVTKDDYIYEALLKQKYRDQGLNWTPQDISEELYGDIVGDNFMDPKFWEALAGDKPVFAKQIYRAVMNWLDKIASMFKRVKVRPDGRMVMTLAEQADGSRPFGTQKYLQDIEAARAAVAQAMGQFKQGGKGKDALSVDDLKDQTKTEAFKRWFGDSKVVDADGKPLVVYHGTNDNFNKVNFKKGAQGLFWFASDRASIESGDAGAQGSKNIMELYAKIEKPAGWKEYDKYSTAELQGMGYDGVILPESDGSFTGFIFKEATQVKSATKNRGTFDPANPDIRLSIADAAGKGIDRIRQAANAAAGKNVPRAATMGDLDAEQKAFLSKTGSSKTPSTDVIKAATDRAGLKIRQGVIDRYAALKELDEKALGQDFIGNAITDSSWVLAKMSSAGSGALNAMMTTGRLEFDDKQKVIGIKGDANGGLTATLKKLGGPDEVERFFGWIAANRADKLLGEGRENLFTPDEIKAAKRLNEGKTEEGKSRALLYTQALKEFQEYRDDVLAIAEKSGIISDETRALWRDEFYVPFYRVMQDDSKTGGPGGGKGLSRQEAFKKLKGGRENLNDLMENTLMNFHHLLSASLKNQAASQAIRNAEKVGIANPVPESRRDTDKSTFVLKNGQKVYYEIDDPLVFESITSLSDPGLNNFAVKTMSAFKRVFTNLTTVTPQFVIANTFRDLLQASATSPTSKNVALNAVQGLKTYRDQKTRAEMLASGGAFSFGHIYGMDPDEVKASLRKTVKGADLISDPSMIPGILRKGWKHWNDAIDTSENISRAATYAQNVQGLGKLRAAFEARDVMDFSQHGAWPAVRLLVRVVPFLNARLQGLDKLYRSGVKPSILTAMGKGTDTDKQAAARFATVAGALAVATMALYMVNADDEEYQKLEEWQKDTYWFFRIGDNAFFLPKPFEVGAIATLAERTLQQFMDDKATGKLFGERVKEMLMQTFAFNPVPQMFQPIVDVYANRDAFTGRDIETMGMERLSPGLRARDTTTAVGRGLSATTRVFGDESAIAVSPVQADHLIKGYLGGVGASSAGILDTMYRAATGQESPDKRLSEYQPIRRFYRDLGAPAPNSRYSTLFYDGLREANRVYADVMELQKLGKTEEAQELRTEKQNVLRMRQQLNAQQRRLSDINQRMQTVRRADKDGEWKRREIDMLNTQKALITERMGKMIEIVRAE